MSDPMARTVAENAIRETLQRRRDDQVDGGPLATARAVVGQFQTHLEHRDGLRRVVLTGEWEVEPRP